MAKEMTTERQYYCLQCFDSNINRDCPLEAGETMTDIVARLRAEAKVVFDQPEGEKAMLEAADEIERLRKEKTELLKKRNTEEMQKMIDYWGHRAEKAEKEIERLRFAHEGMLSSMSDATEVMEDQKAEIERLRQAVQHESDCVEAALRAANKS
jgi:hypothetical protein